MTALMPAHTVFLFEQQQPKVRKSAADLERDCETDNAPADNDDVVMRISHDR
jgi:hypothetical protein